eukprot:scaffold274767_cov27-Tisochrysis_lutea.AAC.2
MSQAVESAAAGGDAVDAGAVMPEVQIVDIPCCGNGIGVGVGVRLNLLPLKGLRGAEINAPLGVQNTGRDATTELKGDDQAKGR